MPREWPIARKGTKYIAGARHGQKSGIPVLFVLRDILKLVKTKKEAKYALKQGDIKINSKVRIDEKFPLQFFDVLTLEKMKKHYRLMIENGKFVLNEISVKEAGKKIAKISGKTLITGNKIQMNLEDGTNILTKEKFSVGDSIILNTKDLKIEKVLPLKVGANIEVIGGKHAGEKGKLKEIVELKRNKNYVIELKERTVALPGKTLMVIE